MNKSISLTKSDFLLYLESPLHLWARKHDLIEKSPSAFEIHIMNQGYKVEKLARDYMNSFMIKHSNNETLHWQESFSSKNFTLRADALVYKSQTDSYDLYEIKSGTSIKRENYIDVAYQYLILSKEHKMGRLFILHLNKEYVREGQLDIARLFVAEDVTQKVLKFADQVKAALPMALGIVQSDSMSGIPHCYKPDKCPCPSLCHPNLPDYSIYDIPYIRENKKIQLLEQGILDIKDVPADFPLNDKQYLIIEVAQTNKEHIDREAIQGEFQRFVYPLYFLDYETCLIALPMFDGYHPQQQLVFQYSLHKIESLDVEIIHTEHLSVTKNDPSISLLRQLREDIDDTGTIFVWNKSFEMTRHKELAVIHPEHADFLNDLNERVYDLADFVKNGFYLHPDFKGSWSIKNVLPVLVPELSYEDMQIGKGDQAMIAWWDMVTGSLPAGEVQKIKEALLKYCELDTWAMVRIWQKFQELC
jgi:hypothetical protein